MLKLKPYAHYLIVLGVAMLLMAIGQVGQGQIAWADGTSYQTVPTRTPTPGPNDDSSDQSSPSGDQDSEDDSSQITGVVTDLSTGNPGAGITVRLNDIEVTTDADGKYSLSGLDAGEFTVSLILAGDAVSAQEPVVVTVDGSADVLVDLAYYSDPSQAQASDTDTAGGDSSQSEIAATPTSSADDSSTTQVAPTPTTPAATVSDSSVSTQASGDTTTADDNPPQLLPTSGRVGYSGWLMFGVGLVALILGFIYNRNRK